MINMQNDLLENMQKSIENSAERKNYWKNKAMRNRNFFKVISTDWTQ